jgi:hypothetical protein
MRPFAADAGPDMRNAQWRLLSLVLSTSVLSSVRQDALRRTTSCRQLRDHEGAVHQKLTFATRTAAGRADVTGLLQRVFKLQPPR